MHAIESVSNKKIKETVKLRQKKYRDESGLFIVEGEKALEDLISNGIKIRDIFVLSGYDACKIKQEYTLVSPEVMKKITTTEGICNIFVVAEKKRYDVKSFKRYKRVILLEDIADPGNLGTIIRSAAAFNFDGVVLYGNCTDLYSSKVIRSSAGNFFKLPVIEIKDVDELKEIFNGYIKISTLPGSENTVMPRDCAKEDKLLIMMGSEAKGLSGDLKSLSDKNITLKMAKDVESLNLAVSASIIMYEIFLYI